MNGIWKKIVRVAKRCIDAIGKSMRQALCFLPSKSRVMAHYFLDDSAYSHSGPQSVADCSEAGATDAEVGHVFRVRHLENTHHSDAIRWVKFTLLTQTLSPRQRRILRPRGWAASTRFQQPSWLSVLGMPVISYILEHEKYGILRLLAPNFVLMIPGAAL